MEGKRGSECLLKSVSNIDFNPLLDQSVFSYTYELLGDQMQPQIDKMSQVERQMFDMKVAQLREKDEKKKRTRKKS